MNRSYSPSENRRGRIATLVMVAALGLLGVVLVAATSQGTEGAEQGPGQEADPSSSAADGSSPDGSEVYSSDDASDFVTTESTESTESTGDAGESAHEPERTTPPDDLSFVCDNFAPTEDAGIPSEQRESMEKAAERYILTAYGDPGTDPAAYESSVEELTVEECFSESPAAGYVENGEGMAEQGGRQVAPVDTLDDTTFSREFVLFDPSSAESVEDEESGAVYTKVTGEAVWVSEESDGSGAVGKQQTLTLAKPESGQGEWKVSYGQTIPPPSYMDSEYQNELPSGVG
ncbi:hypothetical protein [Rubrobacter aplysinae]|uniref:hypothetical protein n=1 Tax=Rubrobacter aplysinae TaxID=909625 RepID=UPI00064C24AF|nr:hypothetical protein [Rubrobacter aplysinae]